MLAAKPEYNDKISVMIHMGPVWYVQFLEAQFLKAFASVRNDDVSGMSECACIWRGCTGRGPA